MRHLSILCASTFALSILAGCSNPPSHERATSLTARLTVPGLFFQGNNFSGAERGFGSAIEEKWGPAIPGVEGQTHTWPTPAIHTLPSGMNIVRLPFQWERLQPALNGDFDAAYLAKLHSTAAAWRRLGAAVLLDVHNYAHYKLSGRGTDQPGQLIGSAEIPVAAFSDLWRRLALEFGSASTSSPILFGLMNEPHDIPVATWTEAAQAALNAIRGTGANNPILVPGADWTTANDFSWSKNRSLLQAVTDPIDNFAIEVHQYYNGTCTPTVYTDRLKPFEEWAVANRRFAFLGEFDLTDDSAACHEAVANLVAHLHARAAHTSDGVWVGYTYWEGKGVSNALPDLQPYLPATCANGSKDGLETDRDCGATCLRCADEKICVHDYDCQSGFCANAVCAPSGNAGAAGGSATGGTSGGAGGTRAGSGGTPSGAGATTAGVGGSAVGGIIGSAGAASGGSGGLGGPTNLGGVSTSGSSGAAMGGLTHSAGAKGLEGGSTGGSLATGGVVSAAGTPSVEPVTHSTERTGCSCRAGTRGEMPSLFASLGVLGALVLSSRRRMARRFGSTS